MVLISAHRCGASGQRQLENSRAGLERALGFDVEYVEFDVQRCVDGTFVLHHDATVLRAGRQVPVSTLTSTELCDITGELLRYEEALHMLAGRKRAHIDLKFTSPPEMYATPALTWEAEAARRARAALGEDGFLVTSLEDASVRAVRTWADSEDISVRVGLSLGRDLAGTPRRAWPRVRVSELIPARRVAGSRANLVVAHQTLARLGVARWAARHDLPLVVWSVDDPERIRAWLSNPRVWLLSTNYPDLACEVRDELQR